MSAARAGTPVLHAFRTPAEHSVDARRLDTAGLGDHIDRLYRAARGMCKSPEEAEDLVEAALVRVMRRPRPLGSTNEMGYLLRILRKTFHSDTRFVQARPSEARREYTEPYLAIASLPDGLRDVLVAVDLVGLSQHDAARSLRVRQPTVATRLHLGRQRVAEILDGE